VITLRRQITVRDATTEDSPFLARLYSDTRRQEISAWGWSAEQQELFLRRQFEAQRRSYEASFSSATDRIVYCDGSAIGRILVGHDPGGMRLIDIALFEEYRNQGIGTDLLQGLLQTCESACIPLHLQVLRGNRAIPLYQRLGFVEASADAMYVQMEWTPRTLQKRL